MTAPAVVVTLYPTGSMASTVAAARPMLERLRARAADGDLAVCVHDPVNGDERPLLNLVRGLGLRLWSAWGANPLVRVARQRGIAAAAGQAERWAMGAAAVGAEVIEPNGERVGKDSPNDWVIDAPGDAELLPRLAREVIAACRRGAPGAAVSWTSHDIPRYHRLPWRDILGVGGVDLHAPQVYAANPSTERPETHHDARRRMTSHGTDMARLVAAGDCRPELAPGGSRWTPYGQVHSLTTAGAAIVLDAAETVRAWALPTRVDEAGLRALEAVLVCRAQSGRSAGAVARWQASVGLTADGIVGPATLRVMGLAP